MTPRKNFFFLTFTSLLILAQIISLHWSIETIFFVTWLILALVVKHDSRLSTGFGLVFLLACPFLLIAKKDTVAEQTANYAFFFLAISILVQLEEMLLEHWKWLRYKLDLSHLWQPVENAFRSQYSSLEHIIENQLGPTWTLRIGLALIMLPSIALGMVWLYESTQLERLEHMKTVLNFIELRNFAQRTFPSPEGEVIEERMWAIENKTFRTLYQHPAYAGTSRVRYTIKLNKNKILAFSIATDPESWSLEGDGVTFSVYIADEQNNAQQVFSTYIDPKHRPQDRRWQFHSIDLSNYTGKTITIIFETNTGPFGDYRYDWAGWGEPRILQP